MKGIHCIIRSNIMFKKIIYIRITNVEIDEEIIFVINEEHTALLGLLSTDGLSDTNEEPCLDLNFMFKSQRMLKKKPFLSIHCKIFSYSTNGILPNWLSRRPCLK